MSALASAEFVIWMKGAESLWLIGSTWKDRVAPSTETQGTECVKEIVKGTLMTCIH